MNFSKPILTAGEIVRLDTWAVELAEEARGPAHDAGKGDWRVGDGRSLVLHPGAVFYDFAAGAGGRGALALIAFLHNCDEAAASKRARAWLSDHPGEGRLAHESDDDDEDTARAADDAQRIAEIETLWEHRQAPENTPVAIYLASRDLSPLCDSLGFLPNMRANEGAMIAAVKDPAGKLVAIQLTYITADGAKSPVKPQRQTWRGPHDWASRGVVWLGAYDGSGEIAVCEGVEDGLSLVAAGAANVAAILGVGRLGKVRWPWGARKLVIARDDDPSGSAADTTLYRGVIRQRGEGLQAYILLRPRLIVPDATVPIKDANDLHRYDSAKVWEWLSAPAIGPEDLGPEARNAALDEVSRLSNEQYERARKATAPMLGFGRAAALDKARVARIAERQAAQEDNEEEEEVWPDPVLDIGEVLDDAVVEVSRYVKASPAAIDTVVLWCAGAHVLQRKDLHINISPRLYITSPVPGCGKTLLLEIVMAVTPRAMMLSSISVAGLFREIGRV
jgi:Toprim domain